MLIHHNSLAGFASTNTQSPNSWKVKFNNSDQRYKGIAFNWVSDVTLVHEDDEKLEAHKVILAASSPFLQPQVHSWDIPGIYFEFHPDSMPAVDTKDLKWIRGHNYALVSATWAIKYAPVYYTGLFWIRGHPTVQTAHCAVETQWIQRGIHLLNCLHVLHNV